MALNTGSASAGTGLAGAMYAALAGEFDIPNRAEDSIQRMCNVMAGAIVDYLKANGDVIIQLGDAGLQSVGGVATGGPLVPVTLSGAID